MENINRTGFNSSTAESPEAQENGQNNQAEIDDQNRRAEGQLGAESVLESYGSGSSSAV